MEDLPFRRHRSWIEVLGVLFALSVALGLMKALLENVWTFALQPLPDAWPLFFLTWQQGFLGAVVVVLGVAPLPRWLPQRRVRRWTGLALAAVVAGVVGWVIQAGFVRVATGAHSTRRSALRAVRQPRSRRAGRRARRIPLAQPPGGGALRSAAGHAQPRVDERAARQAWTLSAERSSDRLVVKLETNEDADDPGEADSPLAGANVSALHDRINLLFGRFAHLTASARPPAMTLNLPRLPEEDPDDDGPDR